MNRLLCILGVALFIFGLFGMAVATTVPGPIGTNGLLDWFGYGGMGLIALGAVTGVTGLILEIWRTR